MLSNIMKKKMREKSRECHSHKPQPFQDTKRKRKPKKKKNNNKQHKSNKRTKNTKQGNLDSEMPTIHAISRTVYLASLSAISYIFDTISSEDADFGLPDLDEFSIDPNPESNFFFDLQTMSQDTLITRNLAILTLWFF